MTTVAVTSARSSPGATSLAVGLGLAWSALGADPLLIEADPAGGVLSLRFDLPTDVSLVTLSSDIRRGFDPELLDRSCVDLRGTRCLSSPADPALTQRLLERNAALLAAELHDDERPLVVDLGRYVEGGPSLPLTEWADVVLLVVRSRVDELQSALFAARSLRAARRRVGLVVIGERPFHPDEIGATLDVPVVAVLPDDPRLARALNGGRYRTRTFERSLLWRAISGLAVGLLEGGLAAGPEADEGVETPPPPPPAAEPAPAAPRATPIDGLEAGWSEHLVGDRGADRRSAHPDQADADPVPVGPVGAPTPVAAAVTAGERPDMARWLPPGDLARSGPVRGNNDDTGPMAIVRPARHPEHRAGDRAVDRPEGRSVDRGVDRADDHPADRPVHGGGTDGSAVGSAAHRSAGAGSSPTEPGAGRPAPLSPRRIPPHPARGEEGP